MYRRLQTHTYRLNVSKHGLDGIRRIEFEAAGTDGIMSFLQAMCGVGKVEVFEDERRLGQVTVCDQNGFFIISA